MIVVVVQNPQDGQTQVIVEGVPGPAELKKLLTDVAATIEVPSIITAEPRIPDLRSLLLNKGDAPL